MFDKLCKLIAEQFGVDPESVTADSAFVDDLGADSVDLMDLSMALEEEFGMEEMDSEDIESIITVGDLYKYMQEHLDI
ncbi:MAG: acyl carrier protein [Oscillospiraceae bacterium]|nr:acyl carrier protein [Oscillospiraceae bacterium]MCI8761680.1 acyl carrier protein [Oscillospiraceae bacterium]MCI8806779.1 acyl carrier protein [Oscillospiraceae bacterium]MCI9308989.1 acyl carrier protein [Oscillospiraceae bacterium]MCI9547826.1 acyl carrier protein [Oscillospiraceae bacterium]